MSRPVSTIKPWVLIVTTSSQIPQHPNIMCLHRSLVSRTHNVVEHITVEHTNDGQTTTWMSLLYINAKIPQRRNMPNIEFGGFVVEMSTQSIFNGIMEFIKMSNIKVPNMPKWISAPAGSHLLCYGFFDEIEFTILPVITKSVIESYSGLSYHVRFGLMSWLAHYQSKYTSLFYGANINTKEISGILAEYGLDGLTFWTSTEYRSKMFDGLGGHRVMVVLVSGLVDEVVRETLTNLSTLNTFYAPCGLKWHAPFYGKIFIFSPIPANILLDFNERNYFCAMPIDINVKSIKEIYSQSVIDNLPEEVKPLGMAGHKIKVQRSPAPAIESSMWHGQPLSTIKIDNYKKEENILTVKSRKTFLNIPANVAISSQPLASTNGADAFSINTMTLHRQDTPGVFPTTFVTSYPIYASQQEYNIDDMSKTQAFKITGWY